MSELPPGKNTGIFTLFFRETGLFWEQAFKWAEERAAEDRVLDAEDAQRRLVNTEAVHADAVARRAEAEARLLEQIRLAKEAGIDPEDMLRRIRDVV
jgi:hypothetical protein